MKGLMETMNRLKRSLGLPDTVSVLGLVRMCPLLVFFSLMILTAMAILVLS